MASVGFAIPSTLHFVVLCCAPLLRAHLVHIVTPQNTADAAVTTTTTTTPTPDTFLTAYHHAQKLRSAPLSRLDFYDPPDNDPNRTYSTLIHSSNFPPEYPPITHPDHFPSVSPPPPPYPSSHSLPYLPPSPPLHHHHHHPPVSHSCHPTPYSSPSSPLFGLLPAKLSLKLLLKILLKLVLFKMIVKLLAVICLLLFIPAVKSKGTTESDAEDGRASQLAELVWDSLEEKKWMYGDDEDMKDMREIAEEADDDEDEENGLSGPTRAVRFLEFCVSAVDRVVGYILGVLQRRRNDQDDLGSFFLEKLGDFVKQL